MQYTRNNSARCIYIYSYCIHIRKKAHEIEWNNILFWSMLNVLQNFILIILQKAYNLVTLLNHKKQKFQTKGFWKN